MIKTCYVSLTNNHSFVPQTKNFHRSSRHMFSGKLSRLKNKHVRKNVHASQLNANGSMCKITRNFVNCDFRFACVFSYLPELRKHSNSCKSTIYSRKRKTFQQRSLESTFVQMYLKHVTELSNVPEAVTDLTELEELDLQDIYREELPTSINELKNLKMLRLMRTSWENFHKILPSWVTWPCLVWVTTSCLFYLQGTEGTVLEL